MYERRTDVRVQFKPPHNALFPRANGGGVNNELVIRVQPNRDIYMKVSRKVVGRGYDVAPVKLDMLGSSHSGAVLALDRASGAGDDDDAAAAGAAHGAAAHSAGGALLAGLVGSNAYMPDSYELLLEDVIAGDLNAFTRSDELDALWAVFDSALGRLEADAGAAQRRQLASYKVGSRGPEASDELMARAGFVSYKLVGELLGGARGERSVMERLQRQFALSAYQMEEIAAAFERAFREGLRGAPGAAVKMLPSYVTRVPDGSERGVYYALDLGGTNFRVSRFLLDGKGGVSLTDERKHTVPDALMTGTAEQLFDFLAQCISSLSVPEPPGQERAYGFTFSFPVEQSAIDRGTLIKWTKGFTASGVVDQDVVQLLAAALRRRGHEGRIVALVNDTVGTLVSSAYGDPATMIGVILGTGTNAAYRERVDNITKLPQSMRARGGEMVVNTEWGNFGKGGQDLPMSEVDVELDARSRNKGDQLFEKMISGLYLGEIARCCLEKMHAGGEIWAAVRPAPQALSTKDAFLARYLSDIEYDLTPDLSIVQRTELAFGVKGSTLADRQKLKEVCGMVVQRAANLTACAIAAIVRRVGPERGQGCTVGVDGSVYQLHPSFRHRLCGALAEMAVQCNVVLAKDGSGKGSALIACGAVHDHAAR
jgi:hexokinase